MHRCTSALGDIDYSFDWIEEGQTELNRTHMAARFIRTIRSKAIASGGVSLNLAARMICNNLRRGRDVLLEGL